MMIISKLATIFFSTHGMPPCQKRSML
jgi:hypothetical protein